MSIETLPYREIEKKLASIEATSKKRIGVNYAKIVKEINTELRKAFDKYGNQDDSITFQNLMTYVKTREFDEKIEEIIKTHTRDSAVEIKNLLRKTVASSYDLTKSEIEQEIGRKVKGVLNPATINEIIQDPISGLRLDERLAKNRAITTMVIKEELEQGLIQGKRYKEIANRISDRTGMEAGKALRIARTESHRCLEAGKYESVNAAAKEGTKLLKWWKNGDDERVRPGHVYMGTKYNKESAIPFEEDFVNDRTGGVGPHPGKLGVAADDINCRCMSMIEIVIPPKTETKQKETELEQKEIKTEKVEPVTSEPGMSESQEAESMKIVLEAEYPELIKSNLKNEIGVLEFNTRVKPEISYNEIYQPNAKEDSKLAVTAWNNYKRDGYKDINTCMRYGKEGLREATGYNEKTINYIAKQQEALLKVINEKGTKLKPGVELYRGLGPKTGRELLNLQIGDIYTDKAFMSCSIDPKTASGNFAEDIRIDKKKGKPEGVVIRAITTGNEKGIIGKKDEKEIILAPNIKWKVIGKEKILSVKEKDFDYTVITVIGYK